MATINVIALYDENLNFFGPEGDLKQVSVNSVFLGITMLNATLVPLPNTPAIQQVPLLKISDPDQGTLYITMTEEEWLAAIAAIGGENADYISGFPIVNLPTIIGESPVTALDEDGNIVIEWQAMPDPPNVVERPIVTKTEGGPIDGTNFTVLLDASVDGINVNVLLPPVGDFYNADTGEGIIYNLSRIDNNTHTLSQIVTPEGGVIIQTLYPGDAYTIQTDGVSWNVVSRSIATIMNVSGEGDLTMVRPGNSYILAVTINPDADETIQIGTTPGGTEIVATALFTGGAYTTSSALVYLEGDAIIYISGAAGNVNYKFHF